MSIKYKNIWAPEITESLKSLATQKMLLPDALAVKKFCIAFDAEKKVLADLAQEAQAKNSDLEALQKEFNLIMEKDTDLKKLPASVLSKVEDISAKDLMLLDALVEERSDSVQPV